MMTLDEPRQPPTVDDALMSLRRQLADEKTSYGWLSRAEMEALVSYFGDIDDFKSIFQKG